MRPLKVLTWHVHGSYLWYLSHIDHELFLPVTPERTEGYGGRGASFPWPDNVHEVPVESVPDLDLDVVLYQSHRNWEVDRHEVLAPWQRRLPSIVLEHDPPRRSPTDTRHPVDDRDVLLVHVTHFNALMWDSGSTPTRVIEHGVVVPADSSWSGELERGIIVVNGLAERGRRLGADVVEELRTHVPLDLVGMGSERCGGLGEVPPSDLARFESRYRFFFNPIRYTSLGLAVCEAMMLGMPVVGLATTEMVTTIRDGETGWLSNDLRVLVERMRMLLDDRSLAAAMGEAARREAQRRFSIRRFAADWDAALRDVASRSSSPLAARSG